ncbi:cytosine permease [Kineococcus terrestris]|uniref:cytosine permease n=1 Tax=Kineococcus terrestris TaxID=2044856 RepID=UPI0034DABF35
MATTGTPAPAGAPPGVDTDYPLSPVPAAARRSTTSVVVVVLGFLFFTPTMITGGQVAAAFDFSRFLLLAAAAAAVLAVYIGLMGAISARTGLTTVLLTRSVFGRAGGKWASIVLGGTQVGWYGITLATLTDLVGRALGVQTTWPLAVVAGVAMAASAYRGFRGIEVLSWISVPLMLALCLWVLVLAVGETGGPGDLLGLEGAGGMSTGVALTAMIATFVSGGTQMGNWTRFARSGRTAFVSTAVCVLLAQFAMLAFGGVGAAAFGQADYAELLVQLGIVGAGLLLLVLNLWTTNDNTAYAFGVAGAELFERPDKRPFVVGGVVLGIAIAVSDLGGALVPFLVLLGVVIPPLGGALIGWFFLVWRGHAPATDLAGQPLVRWSALAAYAAGTAAAWAGSAFDVGIPALQGVLVAALAAPLAAAVARRATRAEVAA